MDWKSVFSNYIAEVEEKFDDLTFGLRKRLKLNDPIQIVPYRSYGTVNRLYLTGRVLEDKLIRPGTDKDTILNNLLNMYKRFESDEVPGAILRVTFQHEEHQVITDHEGYFKLNLAPSQLMQLDDIWHPIEIELLSAPIPHPENLKVQAEVLIPPFDAEFGVISDIDDTIVHTSATNLLAMSRTVFLNNARTRLPFAGVSAFYKSLQLGRNGKRNNPFFYVSSSPWNLYDLLKEYLDLNDIPAGPLLLRDFGVDQNRLMGGDHMSHKFKEIENILLTYPHLNFVLIGDSGQEDPKIYQEVVKRYPGRIIAIYIRDVQVVAREKIALEVAAEVAKMNVEMLMIDNAADAAAHAARKGLIFTEAIPEIETDKEQDKGLLSGKEESTVLE
ncbi:App1 family protein [Pedobacter sp. SYSU D00535]|uniref:App1 family protein n=1 Tax=Pedobacter sp. SYSU D00535 TaxID=2810308 RepID=UPI001A95ECBE|nr:phosphatase domain-containing protein [Pedobacter sp. SYSU D00535]